MNPAIRIREASAADAGALALLGAATFLESYAGFVDGRDIVAYCKCEHSEEAYARWLGEPGFRIWLATIEPGEAPVGYLMFGPAELPLDDLTAADWEVKRIYVLSRMRGGGLGRSLIGLAKGEAQRRDGRRLLVGVYGRNEPAIAFYKREGFEVVGTREFRVGENTYHDLVMAAAV